MRSETKRYLESRMLGNLHVRFGVGVGVQSPGLHHVKVEPRSNNAIAAGNSSFAAPEGKHHQKFDLARHPEKAKGTHKKMRAKDRPLENDFVTDEAFDEMLLAWFGNAARVLKPGGSFYIWGGYANIGNYPAPLAASKLYFSQGIVWDKQHPVLTRKDFKRACRRVSSRPLRQLGRTTPARTPCVRTWRDSTSRIIRCRRCWRSSARASCRC